MPYLKTDYKAPIWLRSGHAQTIVPKFLRIPAVSFRRELRLDSTGKTNVAYDFIDGDKTQPLVVMFHGLEGSSKSHYAQAFARYVQRLGWRLVVPHFRSCGGVENTAPFFYHSGDSAEISFILNSLSKENSTPIYVAGISLGGNALAKYLGENGNNANCDVAAVISAPLDLIAADQALNRQPTKKLYTTYFLRTLLPKARTFYPEKNWDNCHSLTDFDNLFTAPLYGFADAHDYYRQSSGKNYLHNIQKPTLILNAENDPFLPAIALPKTHEVSSNVFLMQPKDGGHVGFPDFFRQDPLSWLPETVLSFFTQHN